MDVEQIQKINNLALDLMKQGLATTREEAITQAEKTFREQDSEDYHAIKGTMQEVKAETVNEPEESLSQEKIKDILEQNSRFLVKKIKEFQEKIESMEQEISIMRNKLVSRQPTIKQTVSEIKVEEAKTAPPPEQSTVEPVQQTQVNQAQTSSSSHPRSGNFVENDVSIEKFFYMGNK